MPPHPLFVVLRIFFDGHPESVLRAQVLTGPVRCAGGPIAALQGGLTMKVKQWILTVAAVLTGAAYTSNDLDPATGAIPLNQ
jgi:hypothetical protein